MDPWIPCKGSRDWMKLDRSRFDCCEQDFVNWVKLLQ